MKGDFVFFILIFILFLILGFCWSYLPNKLKEKKNKKEERIKLLNYESERMAYRRHVLEREIFYQTRETLSIYSIDFKKLYSQRWNESYDQYKDKSNKIYYIPPEKRK